MSRTFAILLRAEAMLPASDFRLRDKEVRITFTYTNGTLTVRRSSPVTVAPTASVIVNSNNVLDLNSVDLASNVSMNNATGTVHYQIAGDAKGCELDGSVLTAGDIEGTVTVNVTVDADDQYSALQATPITVTITPKLMQTIVAPDVPATYGDADKAVTANVTAPATAFLGCASAWHTPNGCRFSARPDGIATCVAAPPTQRRIPSGPTEGRIDSFLRSLEQNWR